MIGTENGGRSLIPPSFMRAMRKPLHKAVHNLKLYLEALTDKRAIEIGGPTIYFDDRGVLPIYQILKSVDNCQFSTSTIWTGELSKTFKYHPKRESGKQFIVDGTDLKDITSGAYDCLFSSHCLEHVANPLKALTEWRQVIKPSGLMLMLLPHKDVTFDWRRPVTPLSHLIEDFERGTTEDDTTHFDEILRLHDLSKTPEYASPEAFRVRCMANSTYRAMHQHVFITQTAIELISHAGFQVIEVDAIKPAHIVILAMKSETPSNANFLARNAEWRQRSAFPSDRVP